MNEEDERAKCGVAVALIDLTTRLSVNRLTFPGVVWNITCTPDGRHLVVANGNSTIYVVRLQGLPSK